MRKILTAAVAAVGFAAIGAQAQEVSSGAPFKLTLSGNQALFATALTSRDKAAFGGQNAVAFSTGNRLRVKADAVAENGLFYGVSFNINASANQPNSFSPLYDHSYLYVGGSFGTVVLGTIGGATDSLAVYQDGVYWGGTQLTPGINGGISCFGGSAFALACNFGYLANEAGIDNKSSKIYFYSPTLSGLTLGVSYAADGTSRAGSQAIRSRDTTIGYIYSNGVPDYDQVEGAVNYKAALGSTGSLNIAAGIGHSTSKQVAGYPVRDKTAYAINGSVKFGAFEFGLGYGNDGKSGQPTAVAIPKDTAGFEAWVDYAIGDWNVGGYFQRLDVAETYSGIVAPVASRADIGEIGASYQLATGLKLFTGLDFVSGRNAATSYVGQSAQMFYLGSAVNF